ncbi:MAG: hypothetical protein IJE77_01595, partial [Thermoguttaceae bacterium]|nr:hypothetical protein [Thermoguttaceae bacterium]
MNFSRFFAKNGRDGAAFRSFSRRTAWAVALTLATTAVCATSLSAAETEKDAIFKRAEAVAPLLEDGTSKVANLGDRERWDLLASTNSGKQTIKNAESALKQKSPALPEELYKEYYRNGNRSNYQREYGRLTRRMTTFALAE